MCVQQFLQVNQDLIYPYLGGLAGAAMQEAEITAGNLDTIAHLPCDAVKPVFNDLQFFALQALGVAQALVDSFNEAGNDRERAVDVMNDTGVNVAPSAGEFLTDLLILNVLLKVFKAEIILVHLTGHDVAFHRITDRLAQGGDVKRLIQVVTGSQPQRLARRLERLVGSEHDHFDRRIYPLQLLQNVDSRHSRHPDIQDGSVDLMIARQLHGLGAIVGHQNLILVLKNKANGLPRAFLVIDDQEGATALRIRNRTGRLGQFEIGRSGVHRLAVIRARSHRRQRKIRPLSAI